MTLTKNAKYYDATDNYITLTYTGKKKYVNNAYEEQYHYQFEEKAKDPNNTWYGTRKKYIPESFVNNYLTKAL
jgi:hypothetical protein